MTDDSEDQEKPEDKICSTLRWGDVSLPQSVTAADLDVLIFSELAERLLKVARIVARIFQTLEALSPKVIAARIRELAETGQIESAGNLTMWRHSEVRLKSS